jgi:hypothetical protein
LKSHLLDIEYKLQNKQEGSQYVQDASYYFSSSFPTSACSL